MLAEARAVRSPERDDKALEVVAATIYRAIPGVQAALRQLSGKSLNYGDPATRALALSHAAFALSVKGDYQARRAQGVAFLAMSRCALAQQQAWFARVFRPAIEAGGSPESAATLEVRSKSSPGSGTRPLSGCSRCSSIGGPASAPLIRRSLRRS